MSVINLTGALLKQHTCAVHNSVESSSYTVVRMQCIPYRHWVCITAGWTVNQGTLWGIQLSKQPDASLQTLHQQCTAFGACDLVDVQLWSTVTYQIYVCVRAR